MSNLKRTLAVRLPMMPRDTSELGYISGGVILSQIDLAASIVSRSVCTAANVDRMVTRAMDVVDFKFPVFVGDWLSFYGRVERIGRTSVKTIIEVEAERGGSIIPVTSGSVTFVALDSDRNPTPVTAEQSGAEKKADNSALPASDNTAKLLPKKPVLSAERVLGFKKVMMPHEINGMGDIFGGLLMTYMDFAGSYVAGRACSNKVIDRCVLRFMDRIEFKEPVKINDTIACYGTVTAIGKTSISVHVEAEVERAGKIIQVTQCELVYVAVNKRGKKVAVGCNKSSGKKTRKACACAGKKP